MRFLHFFTFIRRHTVAAGKRFHSDSLLSILKKTIWKQTRHWKHLQRLAKDMRQKEVISVAFMVLDLPCWKCDSVFRAMLSHPRFRPVIWIIPELQIKDQEEQAKNLEIVRAYFAQNGYPVAEYYTLEQMREQYAPDIVFLAKPHVIISPWHAKSMEKELVCYVPYCYQNSTRKDFNFGQENHVWRNFYPTQHIKDVAGKCMNNAGINIVPVGSPTADLFLQHPQAPGKNAWKACGEGKKKVIWAPHWSVGNVSWFQVATFLDVAEGMLSLAEKYADRIQWAFKPHPLLKDTLYSREDWGKKRTDEYYAKWETMPNTQLEEGAYADLFKQSDAMIHDSGSFIIEYLLVDKPCMYLGRSDGFSSFNYDTLQALACYEKGQTPEDIEAFLLRLLNGEADSMADKRTRYHAEFLIPPGGKSCAELIIDEILHGR